MNVSSAAPATPALTRTVAGVAACIALLAVAALPFRSVAIGLVPGFYTLYGTALVASYALTAFLLAWWSKRSGDGTVILSATYFFAAAMVAGNVIALVEPTDRAQNLQAGAWLWSIWHLAFPFGILLSKDSRLAGRISLTAGLLSALGAVVAALFLLPFGSRSIALLSASGHVTPALYAVGVLAAGLAVLALRRLVARKRKTALDVVLALALVTLVADVGLSLSSTVGFSIGTYAARLMGLLSGLIVVVTLLRWVIAAAERPGALAQYVTIAEDAPNVMYLFDEDTESLYVNSRWTELTGQTPAQAHGLGWREQIHPEDLRRRFETGRNWYRGARNELRIRARDGSFVWHLVQYAAARDRSGRQFGWVGSAINLDREHRALEENRGLIERLRRQYESEHEIATTLRAAFLPNFLPEVDGIGFAAVYRPIRSTDQVGGDWYDAFVLPNGVVVLTMGDVSGHGLSAAASMLRLRETLRMAALSQRSPGRALGFANDALLSSGDILATALVAFVDPNYGRLTLAVASLPNRYRCEASFSVSPRPRPSTSSQPCSSPAMPSRVTPTV